jgi:hypothetical protein
MYQANMKGEKKKKYEKLQIIDMELSMTLDLLAVTRHESLLIIHQANHSSMKPP